jgi:hypothetical protein
VNEVDEKISDWREFVSSNGAVSTHDADELEGHLRDQIDELSERGLAEDEAFLIGVKRLGNVDELTREYAREHMDRLWKQLTPVGESQSQEVNGLLVASVWAIFAGVAAQLARLQWDSEGNDLRLGLNLSLLVLPLLAGLFAQRRGLGVRGWLICAAPFAFFAVLVNAYPFEDPSDTASLTMLHLPIVLWFAVGLPYAALAWRDHGSRMNFVRFTGEWLIYYTLISIGGGVLVGLTAALGEPLGFSEGVIEWIVPTGAAAAVIVAAWLVEAKQRIVENMAPVLTWLFTPLFAVMLVTATASYAVAGVGDAFDRDLLVVLDALLIVVLGLVIYGLSARPSSSPPGAIDLIQLVAIVAALILDLMVLGSMFARIEDLGITPNRAASIGINLLLFVNLSVAAWLSLGFIRKRIRFDRLTSWQMSFLPTFAIWAAFVVVAFPLIFGFD